jgi:hypothetical protein
VTKAPPESKLTMADLMATVRAMQHVKLEPHGVWFVSSAAKQSLDAEFAATGAPTFTTLDSCFGRKIHEKPQQVMSAYYITDETLADAYLSDHMSEGDLVGRLTDGAKALGDLPPPPKYLVEKLRTLLKASKRVKKD